MGGIIDWRMICWLIDILVIIDWWLDSLSAVLHVQQLEEAEARLNKTQEKSQNLQDDLHRSRQKDLDIQNRLEQAEAEVKRLNQNLNEAEKKAQVMKFSICFIIW